MVKIIPVHLAALSCSLLAVLLYLNTLDCDLVFDDLAAIVTNEDLKPTSPWSNLLYHNFWGDELLSLKSHKSFRPLTSATFKINYHLHDDRPMGYHLVNVLLNAIVSYLFTFFCSLVFNGQVWPAFIGGILFTSHPIHTEAVAGVVGRAELLASIFFLLALLVYNQATNNKKGSWGWSIVTVVLSLCSLLSKEQGIIAVPVCLSYELFIKLKIDIQGFQKMLKVTSFSPQKLSKPYSRYFARLIFLFIWLIVVISLRVLLMQGIPQFSVADNPGQSLWTPLRQLYFLYLCFVNMWLFLNPFSLRHDWRLGFVPLFKSSTDSRTILTCVSFIGLIVLGLNCVLGKGCHLKRAVSFGISVAVFTFIPSSNLFFFVGFVVAERVLYVPSMGGCIVIAAGAWTIIQCSNRVGSNLAKCALFYLILLYSVKTLHRNRAWHSHTDLHIAALKMYPKDGLMFSNLGYDFESSNKTSLAEDCHIIAIKLAPRFSQPFRNYGTLLVKQGRYNEAEKMFHRAINILGLGPRSKRTRRAQTYQTLAKTISRNATRITEAISLLDTIIEIEPDELYSYWLKGDLLARQNKSHSVISMYKKALRNHPENQEFLFMAGKACNSVGDIESAKKYFKTILTINPTHGSAMIKYGIAIAEKPTSTAEELIEAHRYLQKVIKAVPSMSEAHYSLGLIYFKSNHLQRAQESLQQAHALDPTHYKTIKILAQLYYHQQNYSKATEMLNLLPDNVLWLKENIKLLMMLGDSYISLGKEKKAEETYIRILEHDSQHVFTMKTLGIIWMKQKKYDDAEEMLQRVQKLNSTDEYARKYLNYIKRLQKT